MRFNVKGDTQIFTSMKALASSKLNGTLDSSNGQVKTYTIQWNWPMESYDSNNNLLNSYDMDALALADNLGFKIEVTGEQKGNN